MKIAVVVDSLTNRGGVQRLVWTLAEAFNADLYTGRYDPEVAYEEFKNFKVNVVGTNRLPQRLESMFLKFKFKRLKLDYDMFIVLGGEALGIGKKNKPTLWICCTPRIWLYHTTKQDLNALNFFKKTFVRMLLPFLRWEDRSKVKHIQKIYSISQNVKERVKHVYGRETEIIYPFVDLEKFRYLGEGDYYLSTARITPDKRVDTIVEAFKKMPDKKLIVASGGSDLEKIKKSAEGHDNISVLGWVSEEKLQELYGNCIATIATSYHEDFGMIAIESMAAGKPVIASEDKGFSETVVDGKTGLLIDPTVNNLVQAVEKLNPQLAKEMKENCEERATIFSRDKFIHNIKKAMDKLVKN